MLYLAGIIWISTASFSQDSQSTSLNLSRGFHQHLGEKQGSPFPLHRRKDGAKVVLNVLEQNLDLVWAISASINKATTLLTPSHITFCLHLMERCNCPLRDKYPVSYSPALGIGNWVWDSPPLLNCSLFWSSRALLSGDTFGSLLASARSISLESLVCVPWLSTFLAVVGPPRHLEVL